MDYQLFSCSELQDMMIEELSHTSEDHLLLSSKDIPRPSGKPLQLYGQWNDYTLVWWTIHPPHCKPVELILNNAKSRPSARIERWNPRLQEYPFTTVHTKGQNNPSDLLSQHPCPEVSHAEERSAERYVDFIANHSTPKAMSLAEIKQATKSGKTLQKLVELNRTNGLS